MGELSLVEPDIVPGEPQWIQPTLRKTEGRDPIGLQTITIDRIMPVLVPGILALSRRARYFSFYCFLLQEYQQHRQTPTNSALSQFIKAREYEYALAVQMCPRGCGEISSGVVGKQAVGPMVRRSTGQFARGESVESELGGYGLYYRTPLRDMGLVAPKGTPISDGVTPVDVIVPGSPAELLADAFRSAISETRYYQHYMRSLESIPADVLVELAGHACLCRLPEFQEEQRLLRDALLTYVTPGAQSSVAQRRQSFALFLYLLRSYPAIAVDDGAFRKAIWDSFLPMLEERGILAQSLAQWAALVGKEYMQEGLSSLWSEFCRLGLATQPADGFSNHELEMFLRERLASARRLSLPNNQVDYTGDMQALEFADHVAEATVNTHLEELRQWAATHNTVISGLALLLILYSRLPDAETASRKWVEIGSMDSRQNPGLLVLGHQLSEQLNTVATVAELLSWLTRRYIIMSHENIAYSKLPEFTFPFRWEHGRLRFYNLDSGRVGLTDILSDPRLRWISALAPVRNYIALLTAIGECWSERYLPAEKMITLTSTLFSHFICSKDVDGYYSSLDQETQQRVVATLNADVRGLAAALAYCALAPTTKWSSYIFDWQPFLILGLQDNLITANTIAQEFVTRASGKTVSTREIDERLYWAAFYENDQHWCERLKEDFDLEKVEFSLDRMATGIGGHLVVEGMSDPLNDPRLVILVRKLLNYKRANHVVISLPQGRLSIELSRPLLGKVAGSYIESDAPITRELIQRLETSGSGWSAMLPVADKLSAHM
jgi:hypothetical protein